MTRAGDGDGDPDAGGTGDGAAAAALVAPAGVVPIWRLVLSVPMLVCLLTGFSSGLPLWVIYQLLPAWLRAEGVDHATIGLFALVGLPYTWKVVWSPLLDWYVPPLFGRRRGWALLTQGVLLFGIAAFGWLSPEQHVPLIAALALVVAFFSATQDVALDAWRREILSDAELGFGNAVFVNAYRVASLVPGGLALVLADHAPWSTVFAVTAAFVLVGLLTSVFAPEPVVEAPPPRTLSEAVVEPFREFFLRGGLRGTGALVAFLLLYKLGDSLATAQITPFYLDVGFTMTQIGTVAKLVGLAAVVIGAFVGGIVTSRIGIDRSLWVFGGVQIVSVLGLAALNEIGPNVIALGFAVGFEYLGIGLGTAAFVAFMQRETNQRFTATQYALLSSIVALPRTVVNASSGFLIEALGWTSYFFACALLALPGMALLLIVAPWGPGRR